MPGEGKGRESLEHRVSYLTRIVGLILRSDWKKEMESTTVRNMGSKSDLNPSSIFLYLCDLEQVT